MDTKIREEFIQKGGGIPDEAKSKAMEIQG